MVNGVDLNNAILSHVGPQSALHFQSSPIHRLMVVSHIVASSALRHTVRDRLQCTSTNGPSTHHQLERRVKCLGQRHNKTFGARDEIDNPPVTEQFP